MFVVININYSERYLEQNHFPCSVVYVNNNEFDMCRVLCVPFFCSFYINWMECCRGTCSLFTSSVKFIPHRLNGSEGAEVSTHFAHVSHWTQTHTHTANSLKNISLRRLVCDGSSCDWRYDKLWMTLDQAKQFATAKDTFAHAYPMRSTSPIWK